MIFYQLSPIDQDSSTARVDNRGNAIAGYRDGLTTTCADGVHPLSLWFISAMFMFIFWFVRIRLSVNIMHCASPKSNSCSDSDNLSWCASRPMKRACSSSQLHCAQSVCSPGRRRSRISYQEVTIRIMGRSRVILFKQNNFYHKSKMEDIDFEQQQQNPVSFFSLTLLLC